ncbi:hypothetical protein KJ567_05630, partial [Candidatus Bipolaricaulota bacterium]|nr:hypothetical protein [Candidatus Bipolaricaulota bacterium]
DIVLQVLGGTPTTSIPVTFQPNAEIHLNLDAAARIGFAFPTAVIEQAAAILYGGIVWEQKSP